jgi:hypothetical protein
VIAAIPGLSSRSLQLLEPLFHPSVVFHNICGINSGADENAGKAAESELPTAGKIVPCNP